MSYNPPPFVEAIQYHNVKQINQQGKRVYQTPSGTTPSVTTILSKTKDQSRRCWHSITQQLRKILSRRY